MQECFIRMKQNKFNGIAFIKLKFNNLILKNGEYLNYSLTETHCQSVDINNDKKIFFKEKYNLRKEKKNTKKIIFREVVTLQFDAYSSVASERFDLKISISFSALR